MLLSEESQIRMAKDWSTISNFPIRKDALEYHHSYMITTVGYLVNSSRTFSLHSFPEGSVKEQDLEPIRSLIENADTVLYVSPGIDEIIEAEAIFYFDGTKSVNEVADVIENRIRTYVNEMQP